MTVPGIVGPSAPPAIAPLAKGAEAAGDQAPFARIMTHALNDVNGLQQAASQTTLGLATGETDNIHDVVLSMAKADLSFRLLMEVRNQLISSYQEIMRMQV